MIMDALLFISSSFLSLCDCPLLFVCLHACFVDSPLCYHGWLWNGGRERISTPLFQTFSHGALQGGNRRGLRLQEGNKTTKSFFLDFQERCMWDGCSLRDLAAGKPAQEKTMHSEGLEMQPAPQPGTRRTCQEFFAYFLRYMQEG